MRVTSKGQVTFPRYIRRGQGIRVGSEMGFAVKGGDIVVTKAVSRHYPARGEEDEFAACLDRVTGIVGFGMATDEFMQPVRGE